MVSPEDFGSVTNYLTAQAAALDRYANVPDDVLEDIVRQDGSCMWAYANGDIAEWTGDDVTDRELAAAICHSCPVQLPCLELELRQGGPFTVGVWGALSEQDRRALYPFWLDRREGGER